MKEKHQQDLAQIRSMMERSSRFISLSGASGIGAGMTALAGAGVAYYLFRSNNIDYFDGKRNIYSQELINQFIVLAAVVLVAALSTIIYFTIRKSKKNNLTIWNKTTKNLLSALFVPLITGGLFCIALLYHGLFYLLAPATLIFYGLSLVNASKYTYGDIKNLGYVEIALGIITSFFVGYGLVSWAIGFGLLHIIYGVVMYKKYEKVNE